MNTLDRIVSALKALNTKQIVELSQQCGVPFRTIYGIRQGTTTKPRLQTAEALIKALGI